jgi:NAD(P)-dependent dehydrogenase (short-subunit alcohol dehydrogenase family)
MKAVVLGAKEGTGNIGDETAQHLRHTLDMEVITEDCYNHAQDRYDIPENMLAEHFADAGALVVTLGRTSMTAFEDTTKEEIEDVIHGCLTLPILAARAYVEQRGPSGLGGRIVFVGSYAHSHPFSTGTAYCAAKAGLNMATRTLAWETTDNGFRPFIVHPYHVEGTPMWEEVQEGVMDNKGMTRAEADAYALKDAKMPLMKPHEIAEIIGLLLTEPKMAWMSGSNVELFGGTR